jgi:hypothetical protein
MRNSHSVVRSVTHEVTKCQVRTSLKGQGSSCEYRRLGGEVAYMSLGKPR